MTVNQQLEAYVQNTRARFEDLLGQMVEIPSISMDPAKANDMRRKADRPLRLCWPSRLHLAR